MSDRRRLPLVSRRGFVATLASLSGWGALACSKAKASSFSCTDVSALNDADRSARVALAYAERSPSADRECARCVQYIDASEGCGSCKLVRGPIHPAGTCKSFAAKM
jgi:hypothetical protein